MARVFWDLFWIGVCVWSLRNPGTWHPDLFRVINIIFAGLWLWSLKRDLEMLPKKNG